MPTNDSELAAKAGPHARIAATPTSPKMGRIALASATGTVIEFYDFAIFGTAAALVFGVVFFPALGPAAGVALSIATFGVAFVARPFGAILFGHLGDRLGRKRTLVTTLLLMGLSTAAIGLLPTGEQIGWLAPALLVALRVLQGLAVGGEWAGASLLTAENAPAHRRGFFGIFPQLGPSVGFMLASATFLVLAVTLSSDQFIAWGWCIPFIGSFVLVLVGLWVRLTIEESAVFRSLIEKSRPSRVPLLEVFRHEWKAVLFGIGATTALFGLFYIGTTFLTSYGTLELGLERTTVLALNIVGGAAFVATTILGGVVSDKIGRKRTMVRGNIACVIAALVLFPILNLGTPFAFVVALCLAFGAAGIVYGPMASYLPELFPTRYRYSGAGFAYNVAALLGAGVSPVIATWILPTFGSIWIGIFLAALSSVSLVCLLGVNETFHRSLTAPDIAETEASSVVDRSA